MTMERTRIDAGAVTFAIGYFSRDGGVAHGTAPGMRGGNNPDQGVSIQVRGEVDGQDTELAALRLLRDRTPLPLRTGAGEHPSDAGPSGQWQPYRLVLRADRH